MSADLEGFWEGIHAHDVDNARKVIEEALNPLGVGSLDCEFRLRPRGGSAERWVRMKGKAFFGGKDGAQRAERLVNTVQDISDRKLWEELTSRINGLPKISIIVVFAVH